MFKEKIKSPLLIKEILFSKYGDSKTELNKQYKELRINRLDGDCIEGSSKQENINR